VKRAFRWIGWSLLGLVVLVIIAVAGGYFYFAPRIDQYRPKIERIASRRLGQPVTIGSIDMSWHGFGVALELHRVAVIGPNHKPAIAAKRVRVDLTPLSFVSWPRVEPAYVGTIAPHLAVTRQPDGSFTVRGLAAGTGSPPSFDDIVSILNAIGTVRIRNGTLDFSAPAAGIKQWRFTNLDAKVDGPGDAPQIKIAFALPPSLGRDLKAHFGLTRANGRDWHWHGHVTVSRLRLNRVHKLASSAPVQFHGGAVRMTLTGSGAGLHPAVLRGVIRPVSKSGTRLAADLRWHANTGGRLKLTGGNMAIDLPDLFRGPIPLAKATLPVRFKNEADGLHLESAHFALSNTDIATSGRFNIVLPKKKGSGARVDIEAQAAHIDLKHRSRYLPVGIMPDSVTHWVDRAVKGGNVPRVNVVFRGNARDFPFRHSGGLFKVTFELAGTRIKFRPQWPPVKKLKARVQFRNQGMSVKVESGQISGMAIADSTAAIPDLAAPILKINGTTHGDASGAMNFLRHSPIAKQLGPYITKTGAKGDLDVNVQLTLPLAHIDDFTLHGEAHLKGVNARLHDLPDGFDDLHGELDFAKAGLSSPKGLTGRFLGAPVSIAIHPAPHRKNTTRIQIAGTATAKALMKALKRPKLKVARGELPWQAKVLLPNQFANADKPLTVNVKSDLSGLELKLPEPFGKSASESVDAALAFTVQGDHYKLRAHYGDVLQARLRLAGGQKGTTVKKGVIHIGKGKAELPRKGLLVDGSLAKVDVKKWRKLAGTIGGGGKEGEVKAARHKPRVDLAIAEVAAMGQQFNHVHIRAAPAAAGYQVRLAGPDVAGTITLPSSPDNQHPYAIELDHLHLDSNLPKGGMKTKKVSPLALPPISFSSAHTRIGKRHFGRLKFELLEAPGGVVLPHFSATQKALEISAYGTWIVGDDGVQRTRLAASVKSDDVGTALKALGMPTAMQADKALIRATLHWPGPPSADILKHIGGAMTVNIEDGKLTKVSPGAGRLLALLSLNALPRHLLFNFGDVFGKGFSFDSLAGTFNIVGGNAYTSDFRLKSTVADVHVTGRIGLGSKDYNEDVVINTSLASTLPVAGAIAGGPVTGVALLLLTQIFKQPLKKATQLEYHVSGSWNKPVLKKKAGKGKHNGQQQAAPKAR
jgi:uncharacterized protein (TIGR02099 family)